MKKAQFIAVITALVLSFNTTAAFASSDSRRASLVLDSYFIGLYPEEKEVMEVEFMIYGTDYMDKIGAYSLFIEEEILPDTWVLFDMVYFDFDDERYFSNDSFFHDA